MTQTQTYALVMYSLSYITLNTPYYTAQLYSIYLSNQSAVDAIVNNPTQLGSVIQQYQQYLTQITILDPDATWG
jgi:hypothetical protein